MHDTKEDKNYWLTKDLSEQIRKEIDQEILNEITKIEYMGNNANWAKTF